jgi:hypothetical protein
VQEWEVKQCFAWVVLKKVQELAFKLQIEVKLPLGFILSVVVKRVIFEI